MDSETRPTTGPSEKSISLRAVTDEELPRWYRQAGETFGSRIREGQIERFRTGLDLERTVGAWDGDVLVGTAAGFDMRVTVPGGARPLCTGVSLVTVQPTHRRRGLLRQLMGWLLDRAEERGDVFASLYASEGRIYSRFGFGPAAPAVKLVFRDGAARLRGDERLAEDVRLLPRHEAAAVMPGVHDRMAAAIPGSMGLPSHLWNRWSGPDTGEHPTRVAVLGAAGEERGYVVYRAIADWREGAPAAADGSLTIDSLVAVDTAAELELWRYVFGIDLMRTFTAKKRPVDDPVLLALDDPLAVAVEAGEPLWLRLLDVPVALETRSYPADGALCLEVADAARPRNAGRWQLTVSDGEGRTERTDDEPDLRLDVAELGAVYLGGTAVRDLVRAGRIEECLDGAAARADALLRSWPAPWNGTHF